MDDKRGETKVCVYNHTNKIHICLTSINSKYVYVSVGMYVKHKSMICTSIVYAKNPNIPNTSPQLKNLQCPHCKGDVGSKSPKTYYQNPTN